MMTPPAIHQGNVLYDRDHFKLALGQALSREDEDFDSVGLRDTLQAGLALQPS
jgi:hypothetical protein